MNDFPEPYGNDATERAYAELNMPDESVELLKRYFAAFGDFYQRIPPERCLRHYPAAKRGCVYPKTAYCVLGGGAPSERTILFHHRKGRDVRRRSGKSAGGKRTRP